jgi:hypothetical protein
MQIIKSNIDYQKNRHLQEESKKHSTRKENHQKTLRKTTKRIPATAKISPQSLEPIPGDGRA